jgi:hypothetical protein
MNWCVYSRPGLWAEMDGPEIALWQFRGTYKRMDTALVWAARLLLNDQEVGLEPLRDLTNITTTRSQVPSVVVLALPWTASDVQEMMDLDEGSWGSD